jgi:hypothetical protein
MSGDNTSPHKQQDQDKKNRKTPVIPFCFLKNDNNQKLALFFLPI